MITSSVKRANSERSTEIVKRKRWNFGSTHIKREKEAERETGTDRENERETDRQTDRVR